MGVGLAAVALCGLVAVVFYGDVGHRRPVLAIAHPVDPGQVVTAGDLRVVRVSSDPGLHMIGADQEATVVGRTAGVRLVPGTLLTAGQLSDGPAIAPGMALVGAVLKPGQFPLGLRVGDRVAIVAATSGTATASAPADQSQSATTGGLAQATITALERSSDASGAITVSLDVPASSAPSLADAGAGGRLELVVIGR